MLRLIAVFAPVLAMKTNTSSVQRTAPFDALEGANVTGKDAKALEDVILKNAQHDLQQAAEVPEAKTQDSNKNETKGQGQGGDDTHSTKDGLAENLEFFFLKVAQLEPWQHSETAVELQQLELRSCHDKIGKLEALLELETTKLSLLQLQQREEQRTQRAQTIFQKVVEKHHEQRTKKVFVTPVKTMEGLETLEPRKLHAQKSSFLRERQRQSEASGQNHTRKWFHHFANTVTSAVGKLKSGGELVGEALGDAYEASTDQISFVANTVIDTVEKAMDILNRGFTSWSANCIYYWPDVKVSTNDIHIDFPGSYCHLTLMGQKINLQNTDWQSFSKYAAPSTGVFPQALSSVATLGSQLTDCLETQPRHLSAGLKMVRCLAGQIVSRMPWDGVEELHGYLMQRSGPLQSVVTMGSQLTSCSTQTGPGIVECLAEKIVNALPLDSLIDRSGPLRCLAGQIVTRMPWGSVDELHGNLLQRSGPLQSVIVSRMPWDSVDELHGYLMQRSGPLQSVVTLGSQLTDCLETQPEHLSAGLKMVRCLAGQMVTRMPWGSVDELHGNLLQRSGPLQSVVTLGSQLTSCSTQTGPGTIWCLAGQIVSRMPWDSVGLVGCLGNRIIQYVPPLSHLHRMNEMLAELLEGFAKMAATVAGQVLRGGSSLIQQAVKSPFPAAGAPPRVHHSGQNLLIKTHAQEHKQTLSALHQTESQEEDAGFDFKIHKDAGNYQSRLVSQFNGYEKDTSSCLAFAPKAKHGQGGQATEADWQVQNEDDFVALEPWAVPCGNQWMKKNWDKWQGYSFYTSELSIEKCVTVTYALTLQPVLAFVGGVQFDLMPKPLAEVDTTVCWPTGRPDGQDLSVLRTEIKTSGLLLFRRSLRLSKRFGEPTDFVDSHVTKSTATWNHGANPRAAISRTKLLQTSESSSQNGTQEKEFRTAQEGQSAEWMEEEDLYLASANYSRDLGVNLTTEMRGMNAERRLSLAEALSQGVFQLFLFEHPGMVNFKLQALLEGNDFELRTQMGFGPFASGETQFKLVNIADQFEVVLHALPFVSSDSRNKALESLRNFASDQPPPTPVVLRPESI
ncbi:unnamed protein product [Symbiodinium sp. CCMP2456]|nr:unnamed protein product [Symbiodinium sp. CCMP2456]